MSLPLKRVLIIQLADIGDLVLSTPAIDALRAAHPGIHIALLTSRHTVPVIADTGIVDEIIPFERVAYNNSKSMLVAENRNRILGLRRGNYDAVLFFHHFTLKWGALKFAMIGLWSGARWRVGLENGRGWFLTHRLPDGGFGARHQAQYWLDLAGLLGADTTPRPAVVSAAPYPLPQAQKRVVIHAGSGGFSPARRWSPEGFAAVADALSREYGAQIVLVGGANDDGDRVHAAMTCDALNLTGKTSLPELAGVIRQADLFIGADSGVLHIASATGVPVLAVFGPSNDDAWGPWSPGGRTAVVRALPLCAPCSYDGHEVGLRDGCEARTCMKMVTPALVLKSARALLDGHAAPDPRPTRPPSRPRPRVKLLGLPVDDLTYDEWLEQVAGWLSDPAGAPRQICTINPEFVMMAQSDVNFRHILLRADLCIPDGVGLLIGARLTGQRLRQRVTGSDGVPRLAERAAREGWRLYLLGAAEGVAQAAADALTAQYPGLQIAGTFSGDPSAGAEDALVERINASGADILLVAYGAPAQDAWIARNLPRLNVRLAMGVGGTFDFLAGRVPRAPRLMRRYGLEWLYRLYLEPSRARRMTRLPRFLWAVVRRGRRARWIETAPDPAPL